MDCRDIRTVRHALPLGGDVEQRSQPRRIRTTSEAENRFSSDFILLPFTRENTSGDKQ